MAPLSRGKGHRLVGMTKLPHINHVRELEPGLMAYYYSSSASARSGGKFVPCMVVGKLPGIVSDPVFHVEGCKEQVRREWLLLMSDGTTKSYWRYE